MNKTYGTGGNAHYTGSRKSYGAGGGSGGYNTGEVMVKANESYTITVGGPGGSTHSGDGTPGYSYTGSDVYRPVGGCVLIEWGGDI